MNLFTTLERRMVSLLKELKNAVLNYDVEGAVEAAKKVLKEGVDPIMAIEEGLASGIREVGDKYGAGEVFLTELMMAAEAMKAAVEVLKPEILKRGSSLKTLGKVLIGTVEGDIHDIGKNLVATMLMVNGFEVIDLGADVPVEVFVQKVKELKPNILGMSALLTTTMPKQKEVIEKLREEGLRDKVKVLVGGAPVTEEWAREIGADGYAPNAIEAVKVAKRVLNLFE